MIKVNVTQIKDFITLSGLSAQTSGFDKGVFFEKDKTSLNTYPTLLLYQILTFEQTNQTNLPKSKILSPVIIDQAIRRSKNCNVPGCIAALLFSALKVRLY